jgi:hypothetical protein
MLNIDNALLVYLYHTYITAHIPIPHLFHFSYTYITPIVLLVYLCHTYHEFTPVLLRFMLLDL